MILTMLMLLHLLVLTAVIIHSYSSIEAFIKQMLTTEQHFFQSFARDTTLRKNCLVSSGSVLPLTWLGKKLFWSSFASHLTVKKCFMISSVQNSKGGSQCIKYWALFDHYNDVMMSSMASQITGMSVVYSTICSGTDQRKQQRSASLAFVRGNHWWPVNFPHKGPVTQKMFPLDDIIMIIFSWTDHSSSIT